MALVERASAARCEAEASKILAFGGLYWQWRFLLWQYLPRYHVGTARTRWLALWGNGKSLQRGLVSSHFTRFALQVWQPERTFGAQIRRFGSLPPMVLPSFFHSCQRISVCWCWNEKDHDTDHVLKHSTNSPRRPRAEKRPRRQSRNITISSRGSNPPLHCSTIVSPFYLPAVLTSHLVIIALSYYNTSLPLPVHFCPMREFSFQKRYAVLT